MRCNCTAGISLLQDDSSLGEALGKAMEDMTNSTHHKFKQRSRAPTSQSVFLFVTSIARTNLEVELVQKGNSLVTCASSCGLASGSASCTESSSGSDSGLGTASGSKSGADTVLVDNIVVPLTSKRTCIGETVVLITCRISCLGMHGNDFLGSRYFSEISRIRIRRRINLWEGQEREWEGGIREGK